MLVKMRLVFLKKISQELFNDNNFFDYSFFKNQLEIFYAKMLKSGAATASFRYLKIYLIVDW